MPSNLASRVSRSSGTAAGGRSKAGSDIAPGLSNSGCDARGTHRVGNHSSQLEYRSARPTCDLNVLVVESTASSVRVSPRPHCGHGSQFWKKALREAERELDAATTRTALDAAAKKLMRAKAGLKRLQVETQPNPA